MHYRLRLTAVVVAVLPLFGAFGADLSLIPMPRSLARSEGVFHLAGTTALVCADGSDRGCNFAADSFARLVRATDGLVLVRRTAASGPAVYFRRAAAPAGEGYRLTVTPEKIEIAAASDAGLLYGAVTLYQLATQTVGAGAPDIPALSIEDSPRFAWRGLMLDSARHIQSPAAIKALLDAMAWHKLNVLQWHLADDQGWRIEIKKYPRLTKIGAFRFNAREGRYGGFYTQIQIRDIVAYAKDRNITVVPEIEMPGHALAAIVAYPRLGAVRRIPKGVSGDWGVFPYLYNVDETTFKFLENVLTEVMALFPSEYIHVGGDEAPKDQWNASRHVQRRMRALGIKDTRALQGYFTARIGRFLEAHGRRLIGWDEILEGHPPARSAVMSWRTVESAGEAAELGHDVVLSPAPMLYLDYCQALRSGEPTCRGMESTLHDVYAFDPAPKGALQNHLLGVQANIWTEHMPHDGSVFYAAFPRAAALAEVAWSESRDWNGFLARLPVEMERYGALKVPYSPAVFAVDVSVADARVSLANQARFGIIRYTLDGSAPTSASPAYSVPFDVTLPITLTAATFADAKRIGPVTTEHLDAASILKRTSWTMDQCSNDLPLAQRNGAVVSLVNVMNPCWMYRDLDLAPLRGLALSLGPLPFNFQIGQDIKKIPLDPHAARGGELEIRRDTCTGPLLATLKLPKTRGFKTLSVSWAPQNGVHDICLNFARRKVDPVWAVDWVQPLRKE